MEFVAIAGALILVLVLFGLLYRASRTFEAGAHATFITTKGGDYHGALREPTTLWNPSIRVLRDRHAPDITFVTCDASGSEYFEKSLVMRRTGEISLRVNTCAPRPFISRTAENRQLRVRARIAFQLDIDRIQIPVQMQSFGALLGARIENLFDNAIGEYENQDVRSRQGEIEAKVLQQLQDIEFPPDPTHPAGMPLGIRVYEAAMSIEPVAAPVSEAGGGAVKGAMSYTTEELDELADMLEKANPATVETLMRMMELQTRHNIVEMLCKSGGLVAFTAPELGLSERPLDRAISGVNRMAPVPADPAPPSAPAVAPATSGVDAPAVPLDAAAAYYAKGAPKA